MIEYRTVMQYLKDSTPYPLLWDDKDEELNVIANQEGWRIVSVSHFTEKQRFVMLARETVDNIPDDLITMSEAARLIRGEATDGMLAYVNSLVLRGKLKRYEDESEPNPQRRGRVSRSAVMEFKNDRDEIVTHDDS